MKRGRSPDLPSAVLGSAAFSAGLAAPGPASATCMVLGLPADSAERMSAYMTPGLPVLAATACLDAASATFCASPTVRGLQASVSSLSSALPGSAASSRTLATASSRTVWLSRR